MIGGTETIPAEPGGGDWVIVAGFGRVHRREAVLFGVLLADGGLVWSTYAERATTFLTKARAIDILGAARRRGDVSPGTRVVAERIDVAVHLGRLARRGVVDEA